MTTHGLRTTLALFCAAVIVCGCSDRKAPTVNVAPPPSSGPPKAPPPTVTPAEGTAPSQTPPPDTGFINDPNIEMLTIAISDYFSAKGTVPADINELVRAKFIDRAPTPPPGRKYVVDPVKRTVKVASQ